MIGRLMMGKDPRTHSCAPRLIVNGRRMPDCGQRIVDHGSALGLMRAKVGSTIDE
jgi:hypothetical protein